MEKRRVLKDNNVRRSALFILGAIVKYTGINGGFAVESGIF